MKHRAQPRVEPNEVLSRLILDTGTRTLGELIQERQMAVSEILRLRSLIFERSWNDRSTADGKDDAPAAPRPQRNQAELLTLRDVCAVVSLSRSTVYSLLKAGKFPPPVQVSARSVRWRRIEIDCWQSNLSAGDEHG